MQLKNSILASYVLFIFFSNSNLFCADVQKKLKEDFENITVKLCIEEPTPLCLNYLLSCCNLCNKCTSSCPSHAESMVEIPRNSDVYPWVQKYVENNYEYDFNNITIKIKRKAYDCYCCCNNELPKNIKAHELDTDTIWVEFWITCPN